MKLLLLALALVYVGYTSLMVWLHPRFIYPFQPIDRVLSGFSRVELRGADGTPVFVQERPGDGPVVLYLMGNAGAVPLFEVAFQAHIAAGRHIVALEYRGGGGRPGVASEAALKRDALVAADYARGLGMPLIVQGFSVGTGLATHVAARREVDAVILTAPYDRLCRLMAAQSRSPACLLPWVQKWNSLKDARAITAPTLVLHGAEDVLIPPAYSEPFGGLAHVERVLIDGAAHNDISAFPAYHAAIAAFLEPHDPGGSSK